MVRQMGKSGGVSDSDDAHLRALDDDILALAKRLTALAQRLRALEPVDEDWLALATEMEGVAQKAYRKAQLAAELTTRIQAADHSVSD